MISKRYSVANFSTLQAVACPCGMSRRAFIKESDPKVSFHIVEIKENSQIHYHKNHKEVYYILEGNGYLELDGESLPVSPGTSVLIHEKCRHRACGFFKIINVSLPAFDPEDEWFD